MEWRISFKSLILILLAISFVCSSNDNVYYIFPSDADCPARHSCYDLNVYGTDDLEPPENNTVTMIFIEGYHSADSNYYNFGSPENSHTLEIIGDRQSNDTAVVLIDNLKTAITVKSMTLERLAALNLYLYIDESVVNFQTTNISISNCTFIESTMILTNVHLTIKDSNFSGSTSTAIMLFSSTLTIVGHGRFYNNRGFQGGALMLVGTVVNIAREANLLFQENYAENKGGAIFVVHPQLMINAHSYVSSCFYQFLDYDFNFQFYNDYSIQFINNSAAKGGDQIYGASLEIACLCAPKLICSLHTNITIIASIYNNMISSWAYHHFFLLDPGYNSSLSAVSADATRVCFCEDGKPKHDTGMINLKAYPGEQFLLRVVVVGGDYGTTTGDVYTSFLYKTSTTSVLGSSDQRHQVITKNSECSVLNFSVYSNESNDILFLTTQETLSLIKSAGDYYNDYIRCINFKRKYGVTDCDDIETDTDPRTSPVFIDIDFLPCPTGFTLSGDPPGCQCHPVLTTNRVNCKLSRLNGYHKWNSTNIWIQAMDNNERNALLFSTHCPFSYCKPYRKRVNLSNPDIQCDLNRAGILCGGCEANYFLAIGSSHCINCPNSKNLALLIFFAAAGVLLVLIVAALNLTVTQGMINGLIFYANIIWAYQNILFPSDFGRELIVHKTFIAWLNLDFGIETCFFRGMNAHIKAWLQFAFPFYIAGLFFIGLQNSSRLSTFLGSRSVPTLATLLFLSYSKLLRTVIACLQLVTYYTYDDSNIDGSINVVWAIDGNYSFGRFPHIFLLLAAIACFILLWVPYTLLLFSMQWLRSVDHYGPLKFIARYKPLYDAYFAPLNDKHNYWFGLLLLVQGVLLLVSSLTLYTLPEISVLLLLAISIFLLCYLNNVRPYKKTSIALLESSFMINFIVLAVGYLYFRDNNKGRAILLSLSITAALVEFCGIVIWNLTPKKLIEKFQIRAKRNVELDLEDVHILEEHHSESEYRSYHDSQSVKCDDMVAANKAT